MPNDWNKSIIEEFRSHAGKVGGGFAGAPLLLLTTTGRKSGKPYVTPAMYLEEQGKIFVFASKGGAPANPDWFHNLKANPAVQVELGETSFAAKAVIVSGAERDRVYAVQAKLYPQFSEYAAKTMRKIPVVALVRQP